VRIELGTEKFIPLLGDHTFKGGHGGRASMKSYFFADMHIARALTPTQYNPGGYRALCLREVQRSIKESSKRLLEQRIQFHNVGYAFNVLDQEIRTPRDGKLVFQGMQEQTAESIKSFEDFDVADIEEGQTIKQRSLDLLIPTIIRKEGAQIWARWNPRNDTDPIDKMFRSSKARPSMVCVEVGYEDNPWLTKATLEQIESDFEADPEKAMHIWGGGYEIISEGSYFGKLMAIADKEGRIGNYPFDPDLPVYTSWDIGVDDYTAIWFMQQNGSQVRCIDYYETSGDGAETIYDEAIKNKPYKYAAHYLPHDVMVREWGAGAKTRFQTLTDMGMKNIRVGVAQNPAERINAARAILPIVSFNKDTVSVGVKRLRDYKRRLNRATGFYGGILHDDASHGADAFGEFAVNCQVRPKQSKTRDNKPRDRWNKRFKDESSSSWKTN